MTSTNPSPRRRIKAAAVALVVEGLFCGGSSIWGLVYIRNHLQPQLAPSAKTAPLFLLIGYAVVIGGIMLSLFVILGGIQMLRVRNYGWAIIASVLSFPTAVFTFWPLTPIGVWPLVVLLQPAAKNEFLRVT